MSSINELHPPIAQSKLLKGKVPQVTSLFWVFKVLTTGLGEAASDAVMRSFGTVAAAVAGVGLLAALFVQFACSRYRPAVYWSAVVLVAVFGTMAADIPASLGAPLWATSTVYLLIAAIVFALWFRREGTLSFSSVTTRSREGFYWAAVLATFALGTAVGDLIADVWGWGNLASGLVFCALIAVPAVAVRVIGLNAVAGFWTAYVLTRPLGASFADWMSVPHGQGGLGLGAPLVAVLWALPVVCLVGYLSVADLRQRSDGPASTAEQGVQLDERATSR
ncbi:hypothetical protein [Mycolicibacterium cosmeticum]|uniref:COG4705 family protein n=1 Tax=Mycolicibacterium cosmeticum TaxID=258533 RepID=UPI003204873E